MFYVVKFKKAAPGMRTFAQVQCDEKELKKRAAEVEVVKSEKNGVAYDSWSAARRAAERLQRAFEKEKGREFGTDALKSAE